MKKRITFRFWLVSLSLLLSAGSMAQDLSMGVALKGSTLGFGGDAILGINDKMVVRLGYERMGLGFNFDFEEQDVQYDVDATFKTGSLTALYDYYLTKNIFVSGGAGLNFFNINAVGIPKSTLPWGDIEIPKEKVGDFAFDIKPGMKISPYLGVGFGRSLGSTKNLAFAFEMGTYYQGSPDLTIATSGLLSPTSDPDQGQEALWESQISQYYLYPVMKFSLSYKIYSF
jgi:hypothetical protein